MREIKFRAIDEFSDDFIYGAAFFVDKDNNQGYLAWGIDRHHCVKKDTVGQFTGLKDKNGIEIYEGDILSDWTDTDEGMKQSFCQVFWNDKGGVWSLDLSHSKNKSYSFHLANELKNYEYQIVGNIYENQILIKSNQL